MVFFQILTKGILFKPVNITNLVLQNSYIITMALGMLLIIISGWIDLSVGSVIAVVGAVAAVLMVKLKVDWPLTVGICLLLGAAIGAFQGYWVAFVQDPGVYCYAGRYVDFPWFDICFTKWRVNRTICQ